MSVYKHQMSRPYLCILSTAPCCELLNSICTDTEIFCYLYFLSWKDSQKTVTKFTFKHRSEARKKLSLFISRLLLLKFSNDVCMYIIYI